MSKAPVIILLSFVVINLILFTVFSNNFHSPAGGFVWHCVSFIVLGIAFELPEQILNGWCLAKSSDSAVFQRAFPQLKKVLAVRYILTHVIAPCTGITVIASGIFLAHKTGLSFTNGWLFWLMATATFGLYKGIYQHNLFIRRISAFASVSATASQMERLRSALRSPLDNVLIMFEAPTYIFNYAAAVYKFPLANPFAGIIQRVEGMHGPVYGGLFILAGGCLVLPVLMILVKHFSRAQFLDN